MKNFKPFKSGLTIVILLLQQTAFAQSADNGMDMAVYSKIMVGVVILLIATVFAGLDILGNPKYEKPLPIVPEKFISDAYIYPGFRSDKKLSGILRIGFYGTIILAIIYLIIILFMFNIF